MTTETTYKEKLSWLWIRFLIVVALCSSIIIGYSMGVNVMWTAAIEHDAAAYNYKTGIREWIVQEAEPTKERKEAITAACKAMGSKKANDPQCMLMGM